MWPNVPLSNDVLLIAEAKSGLGQIYIRQPVPRGESGSLLSHWTGWFSLQVSLCEEWRQGECTENVSLSWNLFVTSFQRKVEMFHETQAEFGDRGDGYVSRTIALVNCCPSLRYSNNSTMQHHLQVPFHSFMKEFLQLAGSLPLCAWPLLQIPGGALQAVWSTGQRGVCTAGKLLSGQDHQPFSEGLDWETVWAHTGKWHCSKCS